MQSPTELLKEEQKVGPHILMGDRLPDYTEWQKHSVHANSCITLFIFKIMEPIPGEIQDSFGTSHKLLIVFFVCHHAVLFH